MTLICALVLVMQTYPAMPAEWPVLSDTYIYHLQLLKYPRRHYSDLNHSGPLPTH